MSEGSMRDCTEILQTTVLDAIMDKTPLNISGGDSKSFYGRSQLGRALSTKCHQGVINYEPKELVITVRSGTRLSQLQEILAAEGQQLPFEPPSFSPDATIGGVIAAGLSGPARPYQGSVRDYVLGIRTVNGKGEILRFGGEVMKNVAGYDVSRLMVGALGTLGLILDVSLKVLPAASVVTTRVLQCDEAQAIKTMNQLAARPLPVSATCFDGGQLFIRLSGNTAAVADAIKQVGGDTATDDLWESLREQTHPFFSGEGTLWRFSLPATEMPLELSEQQLIEWGGAQRWVYSPAPAKALQDLAASRGGHVTSFRGGDRDGDVFQPLEPVVLDWHRQLKHSFDPFGIFNPGRLIESL